MKFGVCGRVTDKVHKSFDFGCDSLRFVWNQCEIEPILRSVMQMRISDLRF